MLLFLPSDVGWHAPVHRLVSPLVALAAYRSDALLQPFTLGRALRFEPAKCGKQLLAEFGGEVGWEGLLVPLRLDGGLNLFGGYVGQAAAGAAGVATGADEIVVLVAAAALRDLVQQARVATAAEQRAAQVVLVLVEALAGLAMRCQDALNLLECLGRDEDRVFAFVLHAAPGNETDVVAVAQHLVQLVGRQRPGGTFRCRPLLKAALCQFVGQLPQAVFARGVGLEGPLDVVGPLWIGDDRSRLGTVHDLPHVQVAERRDVRSTARGDLLLGPFDDFVGQVARVELGNRTHDAVHQGAAGRLVDVLGNADQLGAGGLDLSRDSDIIEAVTGQPVDLVDDDVADIGRRRQVGQHALQLRTVGGAGRLAALDEDFGDGRVEAGSMA